MTVPTLLAPKTKIPDLCDAVLAARAGDTQTARQLIDRILRAKPDHEQALLWKAVLCRSEESPEAYLEQVLELNPANGKAFETLALWRVGKDSWNEGPAKVVANCPVCYRATNGDVCCCSCGSMVTLVSWNDFLNNDDVDERRVQAGVDRWLQGMQRSVSAGTAYLLALGYLNLKRSGEACFYLQKARAMGITEPGMNELIEFFQSKPLILVVEENTLVRRFLNTVLVKSGYRVVTGMDNGEGLKLYAQFRPALVVCGDSAFCKILREAGSKTPMVLMGEGFGVSVKAKLAGAAASLRKHCEPEAVTATVRRLIAA